MKKLWKTTNLEKLNISPVAATDSNEKRFNKQNHSDIADVLNYDGFITFFLKKGNIN